MAMMPVLVMGRNDRVAAIRDALHDANFAVETAEFPGPVESEILRFQLAIVDAGDNATSAATFAARWRALQAKAWRPLMWLCDDNGNRADGWSNGADACLSRPLGSGELPAAVRSLVMRREEHDRLASWAGESSRLNRTLADIFEQLEADTRLAHLIRFRHRNATYWAAGSVEIAVSRRSASDAGGDFHSVLCRDSERALILLGDVMSGSLSASLSAIFVQQLAETHVGEPPDRVLATINHELLLFRLTEPPLVRLTCLALDGTTGDVSYATAGHTAPLLLPHDAPPQFQPAPGNMIGIGDATFSRQSLRLHPGDRLLLFTDGLISSAPEVALAHAAAKHRGLPLTAQLEELAQDAVAKAAEPHDFTIIGIGR